MQLKLTYSRTSNDFFEIVSFQPICSLPDDYSLQPHSLLRRTDINLVYKLTNYINYYKGKVLIIDEVIHRTVSKRRSFQITAGLCTIMTELFYELLC